MLDRIRAYFNDKLIPEDGQQTRRADDHTLQLASCALLLEMTRIDSEESSIERDVLVEAMQKEFGIPADESMTLVKMADETLSTANDYYQFTSLINRHYSVEQKNQVIEAMWRIAYADTRIDDHERHLLRKISSLLHISHGDQIAAKTRAGVRARTADGIGAGDTRDDHGVGHTGGLDDAGNAGT